MELKSTGKIVLITSGQPSLNPRLVKEADALANSGYEVMVLYAYRNNWGTEIDKQLLPQKKWKAIRAGGHPQQQRLTYCISQLIYKISLSVAKLLPEFAIARASLFLEREAKKLKADLYIAHNLGALPAAVKAAKKFNCKCGFDAEDFHRFETTDDKDDPAVILKTRIEDKYIPQTGYFTASSPQIAQAYQQLYPQLKPLVLHNVFPNSNVTSRKSGIPAGDALKLFWFSQTIGDGRGLTEFIEALKKLDNSNFELHLLGDVPAGSNTFIQKINSSGINITYYAPIEPDHLARFASQFDIGLALEPGFCINNNFALSNKIFTYMQAGLAIIASDTPAQKELLDAYPQIGEVFKRNNITSLTSVLTYYDLNRDKLLEAGNASLKLAHDKLNWEQESKKFLNVVKETLAV